MSPRQPEREAPAMRSADAATPFWRRMFGRASARGASRSGKNGASTRHDFVIAASGIALGVTCALFPWYIFFNQEKFGPPAMKFEATEVEANGDDATATPLLPRGNSEVRIIGIPDFELDYDATGSLPRTFSPPQPAVEQPFPEDVSTYRVLHVTAGRAMIEDDTGIWVVQRGSRLPDRTRVERIERRDGDWVLVTSGDKVLVASD
ncbi:hypothetical protein [Arvimicrobium flavum]|uniref:hypothetical protein n=1 Tax=Arvimicrobium flavum TaxID=3393320 RepID=UPI00237AC67E|nr:hypothetical protein [Mesorhizobium shangrilense]